MHPREWQAPSRTAKPADVVGAAEKTAARTRKNPPRLFTTMRRGWSASSAGPSPTRNAFYLATAMESMVGNGKRTMASHPLRPPALNYRRSKRHLARPPLRKEQPTRTRSSRKRSMNCGKSWRRPRRLRMSLPRSRLRDRPRPTHKTLSGRSPPSNSRKRISKDA